MIDEEAIRQRWEAVGADARRPQENIDPLSDVIFEAGVRAVVYGRHFLLRHQQRIAMPPTQSSPFLARASLMI